MAKRANRKACGGSLWVRPSVCIFSRKDIGALAGAIYQAAGVIAPSSPLFPSLPGFCLFPQLPKLPSLVAFFLFGFLFSACCIFVFLFSVPFFTSVRIRPLVCFYFRSLPLFRSLFVCFRGETRPAPINFPKSRRPQVVTLFIFAPWHTQNSHKKKLKKHKKTTGDLIVARKVEK